MLSVGVYVPLPQMITGWRTPPAPSVLGRYTVQATSPAASRTVSNGPAAPKSSTAGKLGSGGPASGSASTAASRGGGAASSGSTGPGVAASRGSGSVIGPSAAS